VTHDEMKALQDQLELATSAKLTDDSVLDEDTTALREGWLALRQLLESSDAVGDISPNRPQPMVASHLAWRMSWLAVAASLLLVLAGAWYLGRDGKRDPVKDAPDQIAYQNVQPIAPTLPTSNLDQADDVPSWDDTLDDEITMASESLILVQQRWSTLDQQLDSVYEQIKQFEGELESDFYDASL